MDSTIHIRGISEYSFSYSSTRPIRRNQSKVFLIIHLFDPLAQFVSLRTVNQLSLMDHEFETGRD